MAFDPSLCTLDEARAACGNIDGSSQDELLRALILGATEVAEDLGRPKLKQRPYSAAAALAGTGEAAIVVSGRGRCDQRLPVWPIASVSMIEFYDGVTWTAVDLTAYPITIDAELENTILFRNNYFPCGRQNVRVSMVAGYDPVPRRLSLAVRAIVAAGWKLKDKQLSMVASRSFEGQTVVYRDEDIPKLAKLYLREYANQEIHV